MYIAAVELTGRITRRSLTDYMPILNYIRDKKKAGALMIVMNSEGGDANSSEILYNRIREISEKKPVYSIIEGMGASGAYWIATASSRIYAMETSIVGSIGVISIMPNVQNLLQKIGVSMEVNKIGRFKDMTSPFKEMDQESRERLNRLLEVTYQRFRKDVVANRKIEETRVEDVCNGQVFSAADALENHLIDEIGDSSRVADELAGKLGIKRKVRLFTPRKPFVNRLINSGVVSGILSDLLDR